MYILTDTCAVLMLLRIAPEMFIEKKYNCFTSFHVHDEFKRTSKFKEKYPWREEYIKKLKPVIFEGHLVNDKNYHASLQVVESLNRSIMREKLSKVDCRLAALTISKKCKICSTDTDLVDFLSEQFDIANIEPLEIINMWLSKKLIVWDDSKQNIIYDWVTQNEKNPSNKQKYIFEKLSGYLYPKS